MLELLLSTAYSQNHSRNVPSTISQLKAVNSLLSDYCDDRSERLALLAQWFGRPFLTSKELSRNEAGAIIELGYYGDWQKSASFADFIENSLAKVYQF